MITGHIQEIKSASGGQRGPIVHPDESMPLDDSFDRWFELIINVAMAARKRGIKTDWIEAVGEYLKFESEKGN